MKILNSLSILALLLNSACAQSQRTWHATIKVIDEAYQPIANANAEMFWYVNAPDGGLTYGKTEGMTDTNGLFITSHAANGSISLGFSASKAGYYLTRSSQEIAPLKENDPAKWNHSVTLMLKTIGKPIPMYAKSVNLGMPVFDKPVGFDFMAGDWVEPYGKGTHADIFFTGHFDKHSGGKNDYTLTVSFPNRGDGIQEFDVPLLLQNAKMGQSDLRSSQKAPAHGYRPAFVEASSDQNRNFYFRVHTVLDRNGHIKSALYGKIYGDFMQFTYYLDPTPNDRDVEFDVGHNLLPGLKSFEQVSQP